MRRFIAFACLFLTGCTAHRPDCACYPNATSVQTRSSEQLRQNKVCSKREKDPRDPFESFNRFVFSMNTTLDETLLRPFIGFYRVMPACLKNRIISVMDTVESPISIANCLLQGKMHDCLAHTARLVFNTIFGLCGLFDVASKLKITPERQDFGKTLQKFTVPPGPFLMIPLLGPSTLRDVIGQAGDCAVLPITYYKKPAVAYYPASYWITQSKITSIQEDISETFSDTYSTLRNAYFMMRGDVDSKNFDNRKEEHQSNSASSDTEPDLLGESEDRSNTIIENNPEDFSAQNDCNDSGDRSNSVNTKTSQEKTRKAFSKSKTTFDADSNAEPDLLGPSEDVMGDMKDSREIQNGSKQNSESRSSGDYSSGTSNTKALPETSRDTVNSKASNPEIDNPEPDLLG